MVETSFLGNPTFHPPKECSGKAEQFEEFSYKLHAYMNLLKPGYNQIFRRVEEDPTKAIHDEGLHEVQQVRADNGTLTHVVVAETNLAMMASVLPSAPTTLCTGGAITTPRREITLNGFGSWRRLCDMYRAPTRQRAVGSLSRIPTSRFASETLEDSLINW